MDFEVGSIHTGKVTGITKFGAFVTIAPGKSGLVHISEIASSFVSDVREFLVEGQEVAVKIIGVDQSGRMNLSIKSASQPPQDDQQPQYRQPQQQRQQQYQPKQSAAPGEPTFEDRLKRFMQDSDSKISDLRQHTDKRGARRRGR